MGTTEHIQSGDQMVIYSNGIETSFNLFTGDAMLNGKSDSVWLKSNTDQISKYLRKLPAGNMSIGAALFDSMKDLLATLESGDFYIA